MTTDLTPYDPARTDPARTRGLASWRFYPYRFPPHLVLTEYETIEGEFIYDQEPWAGRRDDTYLEATAVDDPRELEPGQTVDATDLAPEDVEGPESEKPAGVRVQWKRPTELMAEAGAKVSGWGLDYTAALAERATGRTSQQVEAASTSEPVHLARANRYGNPGYRAKTPVPPETISR